MTKITAPWPEDLVDRLNAAQQDGRYHPYTCDGDDDGPRADARHKAYAAEHGGDWGQLIATTEGWVCPVCTYRQDWCHG